QQNVVTPTIATAIPTELGSCTDDSKRRILSLLHSRLELNKIIRSSRNSLHDPCAISTNPAWSNTQRNNASGMQENMRTTTPLELESRAQPQDHASLAEN
ncbi:hypothetical protein IFM47457_00455, partial [Aspergillus lentulus]